MSLLAAMMRDRACSAGLIACIAVFATATELQAERVSSAKIEKLETMPDRGGIRATLSNTGARTITAFSISFFQQKDAAERIPCGAHGEDMIDWSDPMPNRGTYVHMHRNWVVPGGTISLDGYPRCAGLAVPLDSIQAEISFIIFDDGSGEGDSREMNFILRTRQQARDERIRWIGRFTTLRDTSDLRSATRNLYRDLVDAAHASEIAPDNAAKQGMAKPVRDEMQHLALELTQWSEQNDSLEKNEYFAWRVTDLEQRTARLVRGAGSAVPPQ
jgi:hypothetical protein